MATYVSPHLYHENIATSAVRPASTLCSVSATVVLRRPLGRQSRMTTYTITITPEGADGTTTSLRLDVTRGVATLTDVHLHAGAGLSRGQLPAIDYAMLLRAVGQETAAPAKAAGAGKAAGRGRQPAKRTRRAGPAAEPAKVTRARVAAKKTARGAGGEGRAYRRMPEDLATVFNRLGGASAVAEHYGVPRHTVQGWLRRLRSQGVLPPR